QRRAVALDDHLGRELDAAEGVLQVVSDRMDEGVQLLVLGRDEERREDDRRRPECAVDEQMVGTQDPQCQTRGAEYAAHDLPGHGAAYPHPPRPDKKRASQRPDVTRSAATPGSRAAPRAATAAASPSGRARASAPRPSR